MKKHRKNSKSEVTFPDVFISKTKHSNGRKMKNRGIGWTGFIAILIVWTLGLSYAISPQFRGGVNDLVGVNDDTVSISEMKENPSEYIGKKVKVEAYVVFSSISPTINETNGLISEEKTGEGNQLNFTYSGQKDLVMNGRYFFTGKLQSDGEFKVTKIKAA